MDGPKHDPGKKLDQKTETDPLRQVAEHRLDGAKTSGDKFALLESLLIEGKLSRTPYAGPQALKTEAPLASREILTDAVAGQSTIAVQAAQMLPEHQKVQLMDRVLEERPNLSMKELNAACEMLDIDAKPFIDRMVEVKTEKLEQAIDQAIKAQTLTNIIMTFQYQSREDIEVVVENFEQKKNQSIQQSVSKLLKGPEHKLDFDLSLFGRAESPREDLERAQAVLAFHKGEREKNGLFRVKADHVHLNSAEDKLKRAESFLRGEDLFDEETYDEFLSHLKGAKDDLNLYQETVSPYDKDPAAYLALWLALACIVAISYLSYTSHTPLLITAVFGFVGLLWMRTMHRNRSASEELVEKLAAKYLTESQRRIFIKSARIKSRIV